MNLNGTKRISFLLIRSYTKLSPQRFSSLAFWSTRTRPDTSPGQLAHVQSTSFDCVRWFGRQTGKRVGGHNFSQFSPLVLPGPLELFFLFFSSIQKLKSNQLSFHGQSRVKHYSSREKNQNFNMTIKIFGKKCHNHKCHNHKSLLKASGDFYEIYFLSNLKLDYFWK